MLYRVVKRNANEIVTESVDIIHDSCDGYGDLQMTFGEGKQAKTSVLACWLNVRRRNVTAW
jgi:hypothetical protein